MNKTLQVQELNQLKAIKHKLKVHKIKSLNYIYKIVLKMQGWGYSKNNVNLNTQQKVQKKQQSVWEVANQNIIIVPDIDAQTQAIQTDVSNPTGLQVEKLVDFYDMQIQTRKNTLPATEQGVDLSMMLSLIVTNEDLQQKDEAWEFSKLKTQVYELVSKLNKF